MDGLLTSVWGFLTLAWPALVAGLLLQLTLTQWAKLYFPVEWRKPKREPHAHRIRLGSSDNRTGKNERIGTGRHLGLRSRNVHCLIPRQQVVQGSRPRQLELPSIGTCILGAGVGRRGSRAAGIPSEN